MTSLGPPEAELEIRDGVARATAFDDIYFSPADGLAESRAVFLSGCGLPDAWARADQFTVAELGFGSGLNFLACWDAWARTRPDDGCLHFVSVDGFPLSDTQAAAMLDRIDALNTGDVSELADKRTALLKAWPPRMRGVHRIALSDRVSLTIAHLDALDALAQLEFSADAWFLDGFAPAKNPAMWSQDVMAAIAARTKPGARLASFTVAGEVRRSLSACGFDVEKKPGFGKKRERLEARFHDAAVPARRASTAKANLPAKPRTAIIIGAGPAGAFTAFALRKRGVDVTLLDSAAQLRGSASGAPFALMTPRLDLDDRPEARFHRCAWAFAEQAYARHPFAEHDASQPIDALRLMTDENEKLRLTRIAASNMAPTDWISARVDARGLSLHRCRIISPPKTCEAAIGDSQIMRERCVAALERVDGGWRALDADGRDLARAASCVIANGPGAHEFAQTEPLPLTASRGQLTSAPYRDPNTAWRQGGALLYGGHAFSAGDGRLYFGATYAPCALDAPLHARPEDDAQNLAQLCAAAPAFADEIETDDMLNHIGMRATTPDRLPICGPVPDWPAFAARFAHLKTGARDPGGSVPYQEGLFVLTGLGSRAFLWAPVLGEALASQILNEPSPLERDARTALAPGRFLLRALKRGK